MVYYGSGSMDSCPLPIWSWKSWFSNSPHGVDPIVPAYMLNHIPCFWGLQQIHLSIKLVSRMFCKQCALIVALLVLANDKLRKLRRDVQVAAENLAIKPSQQVAILDPTLWGKTLWFTPLTASAIPNNCQKTMETYTLQPKNSTETSSSCCACKAGWEMVSRHQRLQPLGHQQFAVPHQLHHSKKRYVHTALPMSSTFRWGKFRHLPFPPTKSSHEIIPARNPPPLLE